MNIKITYNWLLEYLDTDADVYELQKYLSLSGPAIERIEKVEDDYILDIEVTSNRVDMASVFGIAQEAQAILPQFGKKAKIRSNPIENYTFSSVNEASTKKLTVKINDPSLCSRFAALVLDNVTIKKSQDIIRKRLMWCDIKSINNVIDISNYLMISLGQPTHIFDYDGIGKGTMILRESKKGETITTLDEKKFKLPGGDIIIEDGSGEIIDLCGIMGGLNSSVKDTTKTIVLFVQTYNKLRIRKTSMTTGQRTVAATYFEKGLDEERVEPTLSYGVELLKKYTGAEEASEIYDIYPEPYKKNIINLSHADVTKVMGIELEPSVVTQILNNLGFETIHKSSGTYQTMVPSWRSSDVELPIDVVEEIARVYGYHNLPNAIQQTTFVPQPHELELLFYVQAKIKYFLKHIGVHEVMNYSMVSRKLLESMDLRPDDHLELLNTISEEIQFFRQSLIPSLVKNISENEGRRDVLKFFEISKVYLPRKSELPEEVYKLSIAVNTDFLDLKGLVESLITELKAGDIAYDTSNQPLFSEALQTSLSVADKKLGMLGQLKPAHQERNAIKSPVYIAELDLMPLIELYRPVAAYKAASQYATIKLDLTIEQKERSYAEIRKNAFAASSLLSDTEVVSQYNDKLSIRFYFNSPDKNITENEAKVELDKIKNTL